MLILNGHSKQGACKLFIPFGYLFIYNSELSKINIGLPKFDENSFLITAILMNKGCCVTY